MKSSSPEDDEEDPETNGIAKILKRSTTVKQLVHKISSLLSVSIQHHANVMSITSIVVHQFLDVLLTD